ncbi:phytanoyl-CoA dioxygenase [Dunaliella salina]|uniref:Phytanoyl-CoA dioxygenase n=1 Tax=Dunaliella salina TaxID=3046 RepID=A0ABQ7GLT9_DUNSA|nr:phytanoyl-CoA dioxygenase [Dunaliella salina]|eukprot:KAF5835581.1 phytanoyl-CoA dioxygenase [Dunaliella salina]
MHTMGARGLTEDELQSFRENGYLILEGATDAESVGILQERCSLLIDQHEHVNEHARQQVHAATATNEPVIDEHYLESARNISFFLEANAVDKSTGQLNVAKPQSFNTIGHALHDLDPVFRAFSRSDEVACILRSLGYKRPIPVQSMYIFKQPRIGGKVVPHQDSTFIYTEPLSTVGFWFALEDANLDNGCLCVLPVSHKRLGLQQRFILDPADKTVAFDAEVQPHDLSSFVPIECKAGTLVLLHA